MDFDVIRRRPKPPAKKPEAPPPAPPSAAAAHPPPPAGRPLGNPSPPFMMGPYVDELDHISRMHRIRSIDYTNQRAWRMNFDDFPFGYGDYHHHPGNYGHEHHFPFRGVMGGGHYHDHRHMLPPPPRLGVPPPHYGRSGPPALPYHSHGGFMNDVRPDDCTIM